MANNRDDFSESVKTILRDRVGGFCSNPNCGVPTTGPHSDSDKRLSIGVAAHITAAAEGGPRYNPNLTPGLRSSAENGIWLCSNCADLIDKDAESYPIELLISWKLQAETQQSNRLLNPNYGKNKTIINNQNYVVVNNTGDANATISLWRELGENLGKYQKSLDFAYENWSHNFKGKYPNIHNSNDRYMNADYQALQNEIDMHGSTLYGSMLDEIYSGFEETQDALNNSINSLRIDMSKMLEELFKQYMDCMVFHYDSDGGAGFVNYYWSSFFVTLDRNYDRMNDLKEQIDSCVRREYSIAKGGFL